MRRICSIVVAGLLGCLVLPSCSDTKRKILAEDAISSIHYLLNSHSISRAYNGEIDHLRVWIDQIEMQNLAAKVQQEYGTIVSSRTVYCFERNTEQGELITINKRTVFSKKEGLEIFDMLIDDGDAVLVGYGVIDETRNK